MSEGESPYLFLIINGDRLDEVYGGNHVAEYVKRAEIGKKGGCLLCRHSIATPGPIRRTPDRILRI